MAFLLDTNVLSEMRKGSRCDRHVQNWAAGARRERHFISVLSLGEIRKGIELLRRKNPRQYPPFERWLARLQSDFAADTLLVSEEIADRWGRMMAERTLPVIDGLLAATAMEHGLTLVTRNVRDFSGRGVTVVNPFEPEGK